MEVARANRLQTAALQATQGLRSSPARAKDRHLGLKGALSRLKTVGQSPQAVLSPHLREPEVQARAKITSSLAVVLARVPRAKARVALREVGIHKASLSRAILMEGRVLAHKVKASRCRLTPKRVQTQARQTLKDSQGHKAAARRAGVQEDRRVRHLPTPKKAQVEGHQTQKANQALSHQARMVRQMTTCRASRIPKALGTVLT